MLSATTPPALSSLPVSVKAISAGLFTKTVPLPLSTNVMFATADHAASASLTLYDRGLDHQAPPDGVSFTLSEYVITRLSPENCQELPWIRPSIRGSPDRPTELLTGVAI